MTGIERPIDLRPGDIGFGPIAGPARWPVWAGQMMLGEGFSVGDLKVEHVFIVTSVGPSLIPLNDDPDDVRRAPVIHVVEAMPGGAVEVWAANRWTPEYAYVRLPEDYPGQALDSAAIARAMVGTPYSLASYAALAAWHYGIKAQRLEAWIDRRHESAEVPGLSGNKPMSTSQRSLPVEAICSVLVDQAWTLAGKSVMPAGTPHQCVTPGALAGTLLRTPGAVWGYPA